MSGKIGPAARGERSAQPRDHNPLPKKGGRFLQVPQDKQRTLQQYIGNNPCGFPLYKRAHVRVALHASSGQPFPLAAPRYTKG